MKKCFIALATVAALLFFVSGLSAHCELPCGIYGDQGRLNEIAEDIVTIEKSVKMITELENAKKIDYNQLVRWIDNKDQHADKIQHIVCQYFLTQRIKFDAKNYDQKLAVLHRMLVYAMKCKQTVDPAVVEQLRKASEEFKALYMEHEH